MGEAVRIRVLGEVAVYRDARPIALSPQRRLLLALLVSRRGASTPVDVLAEALWHDDRPATATTAVRVAMTHLRRALGGPVLTFVSGGYVLEVPPETIDAERFERAAVEAGNAAARADWPATIRAAHEAGTEWTGTPFAEHAGELELLAVGARLDALRRSALVAGASGLLSTGRPTEALAMLAPLASDGAFDDGLVAMRAVALAEAGRTSAALRELRSYRRQLADETGLDPSPVLAEVERRMLQSVSAIDVVVAARAPEVELPSAVGRPQFAHRLADAPFVGRPGELDRLRSALGGPPGSCVLLSGPAGIGKTALVVQGLIAAGVNDALFVSCDNGVPGDDLRGVRDALLTRPDLVTRLLEVDDPIRAWLAAAPTTGEVPAHGHVGGDLRRSLLRVLRGGIEPLTLVIDDVHAASDAFVELVRELLASSVGFGGPLVLVYRSPPQPRSKVLAVLSFAARIGTPVMEIELLGLDAESIGELIGDAEAAEAVRARTAGSPLLAKALVASGRSGGALPTVARHLLEEQLSSLSDDARRTLEVAAVLGRRFEAPLVAAVADLDLGVVLDHLEEAAGVGCATADVVSIDHYAFGHGLLHEAALAAIPAARRRAVEIGVIGVLAALGPDRQPECAWRALDVMGTIGAEEASMAVVRGVSSLIASGDLEGARTLARQARDRLSDRPRAAAGSLLVEGLLATALAQPEDARRAFAAAARAAIADAQPGLLATAGSWHLGPWVLRWSVDDESVDLLRAAAADPMIRADPDARCRIEAALARASHFGSSRDPDIEWAAALDTSVVSPVARLEALRTQLLVTAGPTLASERRRWALDALSIAHGRPEHGPVLVDVVGTKLACADPDVDGHVTELGELARATGDSLLGWQAHALSAVLVMARGADARAEQEIAVALDHGQRAGVPEAFGTALTQRFLLQWHHGTIAESIDDVRAFASSGAAPVWRAALALALSYDTAATGRRDTEAQLIGTLDALEAAPTGYLYSAAVVFATAAAWRARLTSAAAPLERCLARCTAPAAILGVATAVLGPFDLWRGAVADLAGDHTERDRLLGASARRARQTGWERWSSPGWVTC